MFVLLVYRHVQIGPGLRRDFVADPLAGLLEGIFQLPVTFLKAGLDVVPRGFGRAAGLLKLLI